MLAKLGETLDVEFAVAVKTAERAVVVRASFRRLEHQGEVLIGRQDVDGTINPVEGFAVADKALPIATQDACERIARQRQVGGRRGVRHARARGGEEFGGLGGERVDFFEPGARFIGGEFAAHAVRQTRLRAFLFFQDAVI